MIRKECQLVRSEGLERTCDGFQVQQTDVFFIPRQDAGRWYQKVPDTSPDLSQGKELPLSPAHLQGPPLHLPLERSEVCWRTRLALHAAFSPDAFYPYSFLFRPCP